jgi:alpha/beta superfamily hydrolase
LSNWTAVTEDVAFYSDGYKLMGKVFLPDRDANNLPGIVFCDGWVSGNPTRTGDFANTFTEHGFAAMTFKYRGWLDSEGPKNRLFPLEQSADARAAVAYLRQRPEVDKLRVGVMGMLNGAGACLHAASEDENIGAVACLYPFGDGNRWMQSLRRHWEWLEFLERLQADQAVRVTTGVSEYVDPSDILIRDPHALERQRAAEAVSPTRAEWKLSLESAEAILAFKPEDAVHRIAPRPVLVIAVEHDTLMPLPEVMHVYEKINEPKEIIVLRGITHFEIYEPQVLEPLMEQVVDFMQKGLGVSQ